MEGGSGMSSGSDGGDVEIHAGASSAATGGELDPKRQASGVGAQPTMYGFRIIAEPERKCHRIEALASSASFG